jgi:REDY-like protein HapK
MASVIVLFNLKDGVDRGDYERWALQRDSPTVNGLPSVRGFRVQRATGVLGSDAAPPYQYVEILDFDDLGALTDDISTEPMQVIAAEFARYADNPVFITTEQSA